MHIFKLRENYFVSLCIITILMTAQIIAQPTNEITLNYFSGIDDVYINASSQTINYSASSYMRIGTTSGSELRQLLRFNIEAIKSLQDVNVTSAVLTLYYSGGNRTSSPTNINIGLYKVLPANADWLENTATWNKKVQTESIPWAGSPGLSTANVDYNDQLLATIAHRPSYGYGDYVDITIPASVIAGWVDEPNTNGGLLLTYLGSDPTGYAEFYDSAYTGSAPKLKITYTAPWLVKPIEIITGKIERHVPHITAENQNLGAWTVSGTATGTVANSSDVKLWRDTVAKVAISSPSAGSYLTLTPPSPISISGTWDGIDMWVHGPVSTYSSPVSITLNLRDNNNNNFTINMIGGGTSYDGGAWWSMAHGTPASATTFPVRLVSIQFSNIAAGTDVLYWDAIRFYQDTTTPANPSLDTLPFPTTPDTILPSINAGTTYTNSVTYLGGKYYFSYNGSDCNTTYIYQPLTGTLSDLDLDYNGVFSFFPTTQDGGIYANVSGVSFTPASYGVASLQSSTFQPANNYLSTSWRWSKNGQTLTFDLTFQIKGKSLIIEAKDADKNKVTEFRIGRTESSSEYKLFPIPFWENRQTERPQILMVTGGLFYTAILDWYNTNASRFMFESEPRNSDGTARVSYNAYYYPKTDGNLNWLNERLFLTVSNKISEVLPNIPNPPSPNGDITKNLLYIARDFNFYDPLDIDYEINMWKLFKAYGINNLFIRFHGNMFKTPLASQNMTLTTNVGLEIGGDLAVKKLVSELRSLGYYVAPYTDYRIIHPLNNSFSNELVALWQDSKWSQACGSAFMLKPSIQCEKALYWDNQLKTKFGFNAVYSDETTNTAPWGGLVDYDARITRAGMLRSSFEANGKLLLTERDALGLVWSEGTVQYMWAGLCDTAYSQTNHPDDPNLLVDFKLLKIQPLENDNGVDLFVPADRSLDWRLATQILYGDMGYLSDRGAEGPLTIGQAKYVADYESILKSYYMMRQLQAYYAMTMPDQILYADDSGTLVSTEWAIRNDYHLNNKVYIGYPNGLNVYVNRNQATNWIISLDGKTYVLPPNGYIAQKDAELVEYSALINDVRVDYSKGLSYTYCNARGALTDFGNIVGKRSYVLSGDANDSWLIPTPYISAERVTLKGSYNNVIVRGYDKDDKLLPIAISHTINNGNLEIITNSNVFKYRINKSPQTCDDVWKYDMGFKADINKDCIVDLRDGTIIFENWLVENENIN
ncbi:MAG: hypothetical protein A2Y10_01200 [Planctomycetes bacterium GWF2_41_51]|nr:MAG: hypothetical protein A2Y10_01200 [Planctomycetes bacterium GWF2_41_51]HBG25619.1 hypothetical protein [Phycisphaerales bacterium]